MKKIIETIKAELKPLFAKLQEDMIKNIIATGKAADQQIREEKTFCAYRIFQIKQQYGLNKKQMQWISGGEAYLAERVAKEIAHAQSKIDVAVAKKLKDIEVTTIENLYIERGKDGYVEGAWLVNGDKTFKFETIYAGGYNIQCLHIRTLYSLK